MNFIENVYALFFCKNAFSFSLNCEFAKLMIVLKKYFNFFLNSTYSFMALELQKNYISFKDFNLIIFKFILHTKISDVFFEPVVLFLG